MTGHQMIEIASPELTAAINPFGAELSSCAMPRAAS
jgi:hypothetical protein